MKQQIPKARQAQAGFSLIEIMVAVVIGMIAMIVVLQIYGNSEAKKRATTGGNDAQMGGVVALASLQRDVRQAGNGLTASGVVTGILGCSLTSVGTSGATLTGLAPVTINHPALPDPDPNTDTLLIAYGMSNGAPEGDLIKTQPAANKYAVQTPSVFQRGDWVIAAPGARAAPCTLRLDKVTAIDSTGVTVANGAAGMSFGTLYNLGQDPADPTRGPQFLAYAVRKGNLTVCDFMQSDCTRDDDALWIPIASNIVSLRAQYGRDTTAIMDGSVDVYVNPAEGQSLGSDACGVARVAAVRLALVARSADFDKDEVTPVVPKWEGAAQGNPQGSDAAPFDLSATPNLPSTFTWKNYQYKVFQTVVPIRTTAWLGAQQGCSS